MYLGVRKAILIINASTNYCTNLACKEILKKSNINFLYGLGLFSDTSNKFLTFVVFNDMAY